MKTKSDKDYSYAIKNLANVLTIFGIVCGVLCLMIAIFGNSTLHSEFQPLVFWLIIIGIVLIVASFVQRDLLMGFAQLIRNSNRIADRLDNINITANNASLPASQTSKGYIPTTTRK